MPYFLTESAFQDNIYYRLLLKHFAVKRLKYVNMYNTIRRILNIYIYIYIYIYYIQWLISKLSLNLLVLLTGAVKVRPDLRLYICWERVGSRWLSLWLPCAMFFNRSLHDVRLLSYGVGRPALARPSL